MRGRNSARLDAPGRGEYVATTGSYIRDRGNATITVPGDAPGWGRRLGDVRLGSHALEAAWNAHAGERTLQHTCSSRGLQPSRPSAQLALIEIWEGLDQLLAESPGEVRLKNSLRTSSYLEPFGPTRRGLFDSIMGLYEKRSKAAYGGKADLSDALTGSDLLARRVVMATIERGKVPTRGDLDRLTLGED